MQDYALTLKSQRVAKFIAVASSALGTVFLGKEPYGLPIKAWNQKMRVVYILKQNSNKGKGQWSVISLKDLFYAPTLLNENDLLLQFLSLLLMLLIETVLSICIQCCVLNLKFHQYHGLPNLASYVQRKHRSPLKFLWAVFILQNINFSCSTDFIRIF